MSWPDPRNLRGEDRPDLFKVEHSQIHNNGPYPMVVGFIVSPKEPRSEVWFESGNGFNRMYQGGTDTIIFNVEYTSGPYTARIFAIDKEKNWHTEEITFTVNKPEIGKLIEAFDQRGAAGHVKEGVEGSGLHVSVGFTNSIAFERVEWDFDDGTVIKDTKKENSNLYKKGGLFNGHIAVYGVRTGTKEHRDFSVILKKLKDTDTNPVYFSSL